MSKVFCLNNNNKLLTYHVENVDDLDNINRFVGDYYRAKAPNGMVLILTLEGWLPVQVGDYVVHLFAMEDDPCYIETDEIKSYNKSGLLIVKPSIFEKYFSLLPEVSGL